MEQHSDWPVVAFQEAYLVVGEEKVDADVFISLNLGNSGENADGVRLIDCNGYPIDTVIYGDDGDKKDDNTDGWVDDSGSTAWPLRGRLSAPVHAALHEVPRIDARQAAMVLLIRSDGTDRGGGKPPLGGQGLHTNGCLQSL